MDLQGSHGWRFWFSHQLRSRFHCHSS